LEGKHLNSNLDQKLASLLRQAQKGNASAYEDFLREVSVVLRPFLKKRMEKAEAEDVLQETLLSIHRSRHTFLPGRPVGPWLYAICENRMSDHFRRLLSEKRKETAFKRQAIAAIPEQESEGTLLAAVRLLPKIQRRVIELLKVQELSVKEVSVLLRMTENAVKVTAHRGYESIRKSMGGKRDY
jgi:RNA polymerase sigma-70 factor (ECF subfamily)